ncbi:hypothetical protein, variant 1 [Aphanomyces astaci]|uniref:Uncharacterized protein n=1 Tax=Aphanomyces astaci TaxID=112090 RepID=W4GQS5_APHAT|nr:hypothetical protein, variant 1 [Aphanomyces astaci]ETV81243.1 hypothetical protein, variant 1 [Aphanomyces astaci]|eukprot:XP_009829101.1 hypothetical protein, variant 1 [Aphanomyces astaci]
MLDTLRGVWNEIGLNVAEQEAELDRQLQEFYQYKLMDANNTKSQYLDDIASMQHDISTFVTQLGDPFKVPKDMGLQSKSLKEQEALVRADFDALKRVVDERTSALSAVVKELSYIQALMGEAPEKPSQPLDLTVAGIDRVKDALRVKKKEQANRRQAILKVADEYRVLVDQVQLVDLSDFDRSVVTNVEALGQSLNLIELISTRVADLIQLKADREQAKKTLLDQIHVLWDRLNVSPNVQGDVLDACRGISADALRHAEDELTRLQHLKRTKLGELLLDVRRQIAALWSSLEVDATAAASSFPAMQVPVVDATEELLALHESELKRLDAKATARRALLKYIEKREEIIGERSQYEASLHDPDRLIGRVATARLLREEKLQAKIKHDLPKWTKLLLDKLPAWEQEYCTPFVLRGERYLDTIARVDADYIKQKELDRMEKDRLKREKKAAATDDKLGVSTPKVINHVICHQVLVYVFDCMWS